MTLTFEENPFHVLKVSIYDTKETINEQTDELSFENPDREEIFEQARTILLNPKKRIAAEVWKIVGDDIFNDFNIYNLSRIDEKFSAQNPKIICEQINSARAKSKFPIVQDTTAVKSELKDIRYDIREKIQGILNDMTRDGRIRLATDIADNLNGDFGVIVEDFFEGYRLEMNTLFDEADKKIVELGKIKFQFKGEFSQFLYEAEPIIKNFCAARKPLDKMSLVIGTANFHETERIFYEVRSVAIKIFNEKNLIDYPLKIAKILEENFSYLPTLAEKIHEDINFLEKQNRLLEEEKTRHPNKKFLETKRTLESIINSIDNEIHFEKGFEKSNLKFYHEQFRDVHEKTLKRVLNLKGYTSDEQKILNGLCAIIYLRIAVATTWTEYPQKSYEFFQAALYFAKKSDDPELIAFARKRLDEWEKIIDKPKINFTEWLFIILTIIAGTILFGPIGLITGIIIVAKILNKDK
ncbi:MAG: hypothetical protein IKT98_11675 [Selenomonadaceae bacterium]|nr:hypothetical protein [Selenomonadaceae bacterium]